MFVAPGGGREWHSILPGFSPARASAQMARSEAWFWQDEEITRITSPQRLPKASYGAIFERCESKQGQRLEARLPDLRASPAA